MTTLLRKQNIRDKCYKMNTIVEKYLLDSEGIHIHISTFYL